MKAKTVKAKKELTKLYKAPIKKVIKRVKKTSFALGDLVTFNCCSKKEPCAAIIMKKERDAYTVLNMYVCVVCVDDGDIKPNSVTENESAIMTIL